LINALLPLLDEIVRRELLIARAEAAGNQEEAAALRLTKSRRHRTFDAWVTARTTEGDSSYALSMRERFEVLTEARADVTADEGAYPAEWDRDEDEVAAIRRARCEPAGVWSTTAANECTARGTAKHRNELTAFFHLAAQAVRKQREQVQAVMP